MRRSSKEYIEYLKDKKNISINTQASYKRDLNKMIEFFNLYKIFDYCYINETNLNSYILHLELKGASSATIVRNIAVMKGYFDYLFRTHKIKECITENMKRPVITNTTKERVKNSDLEKLVESIPMDTNKGMRDGLIIQLMFNAKISVSTLIDLKVEDINMELAYIYCEVRNKYKTFEIEEEILPLLKLYIEEVRIELLKGQETDILFPNMQGEHMSRQGVWKMVKTYGKKIDLEDISLSRLSKGSK